LATPTPLSSSSSAEDVAAEREAAALNARYLPSPDLPEGQKLNAAFADRLCPTDGTFVVDRVVVPGQAPPVPSDPSAAVLCRHDGYEMEIVGHTILSAAEARRWAALIQDLDSSECRLSDLQGGPEMWLTFVDGEGRTTAVNMYLADGVAQRGVLAADSLNLDVNMCGTRESFYPLVDQAYAGGAAEFGLE
jgi:hypothetical protein